MKQATLELKELLCKRYAMSSPRVLNAGTSFDCSWGWQARDGIVAAISQDTGKKILYIKVCHVQHANSNSRNERRVL